MAKADQEISTNIILTLSEDEASLLKRALFFIALKDESFKDEDEYDAASELLTDIHAALDDAGVRDGAYEDVEFEII